jgi:hypothetical protein
VRGGLTIVLACIPVFFNYGHGGVYILASTPIVKVCNFSF